MKGPRYLFATGVVALAAASPAAASTTVAFNATFKENYPKGAPKECTGPGSVSPGCFGGGQIIGYGKATETFTFGGLLDDPLPPGCVGRPYGTTTIELADGSGTLETYEEYLDCLPGASHDGPEDISSRTAIRSSPQAPSRSLEEQASSPVRREAARSTSRSPARLLP